MKSDYRPIPGLGTGISTFQVAARSRLLQGPDHLLLVHSTGYTEDYRRIFYRDIRYVVAQKSPGQMIHGILSGLLMIGIALLYFTPMHKIVLPFLLLPFLIWFVVNLVRGPTCRCYINSDVQTVEVPTPRRLAKVALLAAFLATKTSPVQAAQQEPAAT